MQLIRGIQNIQTYHHGCVLTIGNFDGVHRGHQAVLNLVKKEGYRLGLPAMVMFFEPQPLERFQEQKAPARLTFFRDKVKYLSKVGIDFLLCVHFNPSFAAWPAEEFVTELLVKKLGISLLIIGDDFCCGADRCGDFTLLKLAGKKFGFKVISMPTLYESGNRISSTSIRYALVHDSLLLAENLLGRPYSISGRVVYGNQLGKTIGFPTANVLLKRLVAPVKGVYAVEVCGLGPNVLPGVANIGTRPTLNGVVQTLEVHLLNINMNLYGRYIDVMFRMKIRNEQRFSSIDALQQQISNDAEISRKFFGVKK